MSDKKTGEKGFKTEETVRSYFLRAGFFVIRSVLLKHNGDELTDIDLWIYERSATLARRRTIIDIKDKARPQAAERMFFVKGLAELVQVDGAGVATTDNRPSLRELARSHGLLWLDGADLQRMKASPELQATDRLSDEDIEAFLRDLDRSRGSDTFKNAFVEIKSSVGDRFGASCANTCLEFAQKMAREAVSSHPKSNSAIWAGRLTYLAAAISGVALDFFSAETALRPTTERINHITEALRYGDNAEMTKQRLLWAEAAIRDYAPNGAAIARVVKEKFRHDLMAVPAEGLAAVVANLSRNEDLFVASKSLEHAAYSEALPTFDELPTVAKSYLGAVLDFAGVDRSAFARAWEPTPQPISVAEISEVAEGTSAASERAEPGKLL